MHESFFSDWVHMQRTVWTGFQGVYDGDTGITSCVLCFWIAWMVYKKPIKSIADTMQILFSMFNSVKTGFGYRLIDWCSLSEHQQSNCMNLDLIGAFIPHINCEHYFVDFSLRCMAYGKGKHAKWRDEWLLGLADEWRNLFVMISFEAKAGRFWIEFNNNIIHNYAHQKFEEKGFTSSLQCQMTATSC